MKISDSKGSLNSKILKGVDQLADCVASTLGCNGRTVLLQPKGSRPFATKDGATVAKFFSVEDPFENMGVEIIKQASLQTNLEAGDGTTTSVVLARALLRETQKYIAAGYSPTELKRGLDKACEQVVTYLKDNARKISSFEDIQHIATISANNDKIIGELVAKAVDMVGRNGSITLEESKGFTTTLEFVDGFAFDAGYIAQSFVNNERKQTVEYLNCNVIVTDHKIDNIEIMLPALEIAARDNKPLVIVADDVEGQALAAMIANSLRGSMKIVAVKAPRYGEEKRNVLADLATSLGAFYISRESGFDLSKITLKHFGQAKRVEIGKRYSIFVGGSGKHEAIQERIDTLKEEMEQEDDIPTCTVIQERITRLGSSIAIIKVGASSEVEMIEKKHRIEDALEAVKAAQSDGIHVGGGMALIGAICNVKAPRNSESSADAVARKILFASLSEPLKQIAENADINGEVAFEKARKLKGNKGINFATNKVVDMIEEGIIDPVRVTCCALKNSVSVVGTIISVSHAIVEV